MNYEQEVIDIAAKIVIKNRKNKDLVLIDEIRRECKGFPLEKRNQIVKILTLIRAVIRVIKKSFPDGMINKYFVAKKFGYDLNYSVYEIAINIINEEEKGKPMSIYIHHEMSNYEYTKIDYSKYY